MPESIKTKNTPLLELTDSERAELENYLQQFNSKDPEIPYLSFSLFITSEIYNKLYNSDLCYVYPGYKNNSYVPVKNLLQACKNSIIKPDNYITAIKCFLECLLDEKVNSRHFYKLWRL